MKQIIGYIKQSVIKRYLQLIFCQFIKYRGDQSSTSRNIWLIYRIKSNDTSDGEYDWIKHTSISNYLSIMQRDNKTLRRIQWGTIIDCFFDHFNYERWT